MEGAAAGLLVLLLAAMLVACVCGNVARLLLLLLLSREPRGEEALVFPLSSCVSDLLLGLATLPWAAHNSLRGAQESPPGGAVLCQAGGFAFLLLQTSSLHSLLWGGLDRFCQVVLALRYGALWTRRRARGLLAAQWGFCALLALLPLVGAAGRYTYSPARLLCGLDAVAAGPAVALPMLLGALLLPVLALCGLQGAVLASAARQVRRGTFVCNQQHCYYVPAHSYRRAQLATLVQMVSVCVCWLPYITVCIYESCGGAAGGPPSTLTTGLLLLSTALNPWTECLGQRYKPVLKRGVARLQEAFHIHTQSPASHLEMTNKDSKTSMSQPITLSPPQPAQSSASQQVEPVQPIDSQQDEPTVSQPVDPADSQPDEPVHPSAQFEIPTVQKNGLLINSIS